MISEDLRTRLDRVARLVCAATGEEYGDGYTVTDYGIGISEPGYGDDETIWVLGNWNPKRFPRDDEPELTKSENIGPRLAAALETYANAECHWLDEWIRCDDCSMIFRTQPDSYSWRMYGLITEAGAVICANDLTFDDIEEDYVNDPTRALTFDLDLAAEGFEVFPDPNDHYRNGFYESGWHPGQNDKPEEILARAHSLGWEEGIFKIPSVGQFDIRFQLWVRNPETD